jgi:hypothetical protein
LLLPLASASRGVADSRCEELPYYPLVSNETADETLRDWSTPPREPGLILVWTAHRAQCQPFALPSGARSLKIGRTEGEVVLPDDTRVSRSHASLTVEGDELVDRRAIELDERSFRARAAVVEDLGPRRVPCARR